MTDPRDPLRDILIALRKDDAYQPPQYRAGWNDALSRVGSETIALASSTPDALDERLRQMGDEDWWSLQLRHPQAWGVNPNFPTAALVAAIARAAVLAARGQQTAKDPSWVGRMGNLDD